MINPFTIFLIFLKLGCTSFGGPVAHLAYFRDDFVNERRWLSEHEYAYLLSICQTLPGPASSQVGFTIGLLKGGWLGSIAAFIGFTLPSVLLLVLFASQLYWLDSSLGNAAIQGLAILAFVVVLQAVWGMSKQLLTSQLYWLIAIAVFCGVLISSSLILNIGFILCAALFSFFWQKFVTTHKLYKQENESAEVDASLFNKHYKVSWIASSIATCLFVSMWLAMPLINDQIYAHANTFYASGAMVFGGGHVVLPYLEAGTVSAELLTQEAFLAGYGATQAMPGPMFSFASYLGYELAQLNLSQASISPFYGALMATMFVFLPGFLLVVMVLPISTHVLKNKSVSFAIAGANAAVVGLLAATLYDPIFVHAIKQTSDLLVAALSLLALVRLKLPVIAVVFICVGLSVMKSLL